MSPKKSSSVEIEVKGKTLFLNGLTVTTVYDTRGYALFKSNDVADALGFSNASSSVTQHIAAKDKVAYNAISLLKESPLATAHPRNVFINQNGLINFLLDRYPSCNIHKIQSISMSVKNNSPETVSRPNVCIQKTSKRGQTAVERPMHTLSPVRQNEHISCCAFFINRLPIALIIDAEKRVWFKMNDVAEALGFTSAYTSVSKHVSDLDKAPLKEITIHKDSPVVNADLRHIFINQNGLTTALLLKRRIRQTTEVSAGFPTGDPSNLNACDKVMLQAIYSCFKDFNTLSPNIITNYPGSSSNISSISLKSKTSNNNINTVMQTPPLESTIPPSRKLSYAAANAVVNKVGSHLYDEGYISVIKVDTNSGYSLDVVESTDCVLNNDIILGKKVHSAPEVLKLINHFLSGWISTGPPYNIPAKQLVDIVSRICDNFEKTLKIIKELSSRFDLSSQTSKDLQPMSKDLIDSLTGSPNSSGEWIYIASSIPYAQRNVFKVGSTEDRLSKRLAHYQTGRLNEDRYHYFQVFPVHNCKKVDKLIGFFLREWCHYGEMRPTEIYTLNFETLRTLVREIVNCYENSHRSFMFSSLI